MKEDDQSNEQYLVIWQGILNHDKKNLLYVLAQDQFKNREKYVIVPGFALDTYENECGRLVSEIERIGLELQKENIKHRILQKHEDLIKTIFFDFW